MNLGKVGIIVRENPMKLFNKKLIANAVLVLGGLMLSELALACQDSGSGRCGNVGWTGNRDNSTYYGNYGGYNNSHSGYTPPPINYSEDCNKQSNGHQICKIYQNNRLTEIRETDKNGDYIAIRDYGVDGKMFKEMLFTNGELRVSRFYGMITTEKLFAENDGRLIALKEYKDGKMIKLSTYDANGYLAHSQEYNTQGQKHGEEVQYKVRRKEAVPERISIWQNGVKIK